MLLTLRDATPLANYKILSNAIVPRPIAWVSTKSESGVVNLAPFSFFAPLCSSPVIFSINITNKGSGDMKDTLKNARLTRKASISTVQPQFLESMQQTSEELPYNISEADKYGIPMECVCEGFPPMVSGSAVAFFCNFRDVLSFSPTQFTLLLEAKQVYISDNIYSESLNFSLQNVGRVGKGFI